MKIFSQLSPILFLISSGIYASEPSVPYQVKAGDNLYRVAQQYLNQIEDWRAVATLNHIKDPLALKVGSTIELPLSKLRGQTQSARAVFLRGEVLIQQKKLPRQALLLSTEISEGAWINTGNDGFATLRLEDGTEVQLPANTQMQMQRLRHIPQANAGQTELKLKQGRLDLSVTPQNTGSRFDVRTPLAVTGVRGTHFGVMQANAKSASLTDVTEGRVAFNSNRSKTDPKTFLNAGQGGVMNATQQMPIVRNLIAAPMLAHENLLIERSPMLLNFAPASGAQGYRIQIAKNAKFSEVLFSEVVHRLPAKISDLDDGDYVVQVRSIDGDGVFGLIASAPLRVKTTPLPPLAQSPSQNKTVQTGSVELQCTDLPDASHYQLQYSSSADFSSSSSSDTTTLQQDRCQFTANIEKIGTHYWRVATLDSAGQRGPYSDTSQFIAVAALAVPEPKWAFDDLLHVHWAAIEGSHFLTQVATDKDFTHIVLSQTVTEPQVSFDLPPQCTPYYFHLQSIDSEGLRSKFSAARLISMDSMICSPSGPVLDGAGRAIKSRAR
ncbi:FecR domain-containing protein [Deefgea rivuli]|uniref:FecR domain-containing protein n=1 Tax=Deefgea rivuli TaxID=400948 RepID=UPI000484CD60|nr:FecR domain-containing protein [Deefgea rivuli]